MLMTAKPVPVPDLLLVWSLQLRRRSPQSSVPSLSQASFLAEASRSDLLNRRQPLCLHCPTKAFSVEEQMLSHPPYSKSRKLRTLNKGKGDGQYQRRAVTSSHMADLSLAQENGEWKAM